MSKNILVITTISILAFGLCTCDPATDPGLAPEIVSFTATPAEVMVGESAVLNVVATDPDDPALTYSYQITSGAGMLSGGDEAFTVYTAPSLPGTATITVTVTNTGGGSATKQLEIIILGDNYITAFAFQAIYNSGTILNDVEGTIDHTAGTISLEVPWLTDLTALKATFTCNSDTVLNGAIQQQSHVTANDFSSPVIYTVQGTTEKTYTVTVTRNNQLIIGPPVVFNTGNTGGITATALQNGNALLAFTQASSNNGLYCIYSSLEAEVKPVAVFQNELVYDLTTATFGNGNIFLAYRAYESTANQGAFEVYSDAGTVMVDKTYFAQTVIAGMQTAPLSSGNAVVVYQDASLWDSFFRIYTSTGSPAGSAVLFENDRTSNLTVTAFANGYFLITFSLNSDGIGRYAIYSDAGSLVTTADPNQPTFEQGSIGYVTSTGLAGGKALIAYRDYGDSDKGKYVIINSAGTLQTAGEPDQPVFYDLGAVSYLSAVTLPSGDALVVFYDGTHTTTHFVVISPAGEIIRGPELLYNGQASYIAAATLSTGKVMVFFRDGENDGKGTLVRLR